ncbi:hypothetical protein [Streptomyces sp. NPDC101455]|uniref:hypothetical protein n=1 Tax=Streptomyces sp. NPDC101455 TaxID=3366142 RepID=UPI003816D153
MTSESTTVPISAQQPAFDVLASIAAQYPTLPAGYVTLLAFSSGRLDLDFQMETGADFEAWRDALEIPVETISLHTGGTHTWLSAATKILSVPFKLTGTVVLSHTELDAPREGAEVLA